MKEFGAVLFIAAALLAISACSRSSNADRQAALDDAFHAGLLTKDEYDAKRAEFAGVTTARVLAATNAAPVAPAAPASPGANASVPVSPAISSQPAASPAPSAKAAASTAISAPKAPQPNNAAEDKITATPAKVPEAAPDPTHDVTHEPTQSKEPAPAPLKGCEDEEFKSGGQRSEYRFFAASPEAVHVAAVAALESMDFNIRKNTGKEIEANRKRHLGVIVGAGGERVTLTFRKQERNGQSGTSVTGETHKNFVGRLAQRTWTDAVLAQMACKLRDGR